MTIEEKTINTIRFLSADMVQRAKSGHPGSPMGQAALAYTLWAGHMSHNPKNPAWINRDRFVLSGGHCSALLYSLLYLFGYGLTLDDLKRFRQRGSKTPGHPEYRHTPGVEATTGPLGQGLAAAVGMAMAERRLAGVFNRDGFSVINHYTYCLCGDGCLMEGISHEAASFAGTQKLNKLIVLYDSNGITIEGGTELAFTENVLARFAAYGFNTMLVKNGNDRAAVSEAVEYAKSQDRPTIIEVKTVIGYGCPNKAGKASAHGEPLGEGEIAEAKHALGFNHPEPFSVPQEVLTHMSGVAKGLGESEAEWNKVFAAYKTRYPDLYAEWEEAFGGAPFDGDGVEGFWEHAGKRATRVSSEIILNKIAPGVKGLFGGSADLAPSNKSVMKNEAYFAPDAAGRNVHFGVRELFMTAACNGLALHGGLVPYAAGFFVFSDYMKPAMRLAALMRLRVIYVLTHDSIGVGEDGPTHQPVEQLASLRSIPNFTVYRPADTKETAAAWQHALNAQGPTAIALSRQEVPELSETGKGALKGGYILKDCEGGAPEIILMASGTEVSVIYECFAALEQKGVKARVVSMPSLEVFAGQSAEYVESVLPKGVTRRLAVEAGSSFGWHKYAGPGGKIISVDAFGQSAPYAEVYDAFGITAENVIKTAMEMVSGG